VRRGALSIAGFCAYASVGRTTAFEEIKVGRLIARKRGRSTVILIEDADAWLQSLGASYIASHGRDGWSTKTGPFESRMETS
jgi:hypothetical protein